MAKWKKMNETQKMYFNLFMIFLCISILLGILLAIDKRAEEIIIEKNVTINNTIYVNNTIYINDTKEKIVEKTVYVDIIKECPKTQANNMNLTLLRELKACEYRLNRLNNTDFEYMNERLNTSLKICEGTLRQYQDVLDTYTWVFNKTG